MISDLVARPSPIPPASPRTKSQPGQEAAWGTRHTRSVLEGRLHVVLGLGLC